jgi:anaerobic ribonucleoside-triphosphate reductase
LYDKTRSNLFNSSIIQIPNPQSSQVILDKILINLPIISLKAKQNDEKFMEFLQEKLFSVFELFEYKKKLVQKKLNSLKQWNFIISNILKSNKNEIFNNSLKSISFFGFNEAVLSHCGIELDRTENSESFGLKILTLMKKIIEEKNRINNNNFILSQPHYDSYLKDSCHNGATQYNDKIGGYSSSLIRDESHLSLYKKISLFEKIQGIMENGALFRIKIDKEEFDLQNALKTIIESKIGAISLRNGII